MTPEIEAALARVLRSKLTGDLLAGMPGAMKWTVGRERCDAGPAIGDHLMSKAISPTLEHTGTALAGRFIDCYGQCRAQAPTALVLLAMAAALAACAKQVGARRSGVVAALEAAFDDIEQGEG